MPTRWRVEPCLLARQGKAAEAAADLGILLRVSGQPKHLFQAACARSIMSATQPTEGQQALQLLGRAIALDPRLAQRAETDPDLVKTRQLDGFASLRISATPESGGSSAGVAVVHNSGCICRLIEHWQQCE